ncbi:hypothetical protein HS088_TW09G01272 [Tripterygium wilfordii]|uniref:Uncharacterized protein n=1 Tax=Tripterygium wilfordii TaxID=458696 RepID=A0A7J7DA23_TRIWF|nr:uncharacterized protein LOC120006280 isoform X1 [Tripterygium wilfordii]KAF5743207.1 hypothetical protein HS088_TW09G01272 [Tripterygium wilfordii]
MDRDSLRSNNGLLLRASADTTKQTTSSDFVLQWGTRKRLRCSKIQAKDDSTAPVQRTTVRTDRRVIRSDKDSSNHHNIAAFNHNRDVYLNLRQRQASPQAPPLPRVLRNSENSSAMRDHSNGGLRGLTSPDRGTHERRGANNNHHNNNINHHYNIIINNHENNKQPAASSETAHDSKKGGSSSGSGEAAAPPAWPPKFVIALTNKEKEEDFYAFKGSKLPQRPKKRAKFIQRTLNLVSPGAWLCDLTLERYEVREKKISKKRPRGLKAMGNMDSDSE